MFIPHLPLAFFSFSVKLSCFAFGLRVRNICHYSQLCANFFRKRESHVCRRRDSKRTFDLKSFIRPENLHGSSSTNVWESEQFSESDAQGKFFTDKYPFK